MSIVGWVLAWCGSGLNGVTVDFGAEINKELSFSLRYAMRPPFTVFGHVDQLDDWCCSSQKWVMSRLIQVRQLQTNKSVFVISAINIRCNRIEHWVHLRYADIRQAQYTDTWTCHIHREYRFTPHTDITPPLQTLVQVPYPLPIYTTATKTQTHVQHRIGKGQTQSSHHLSTHAGPSQTHTHLTHSTNSSHPTHITHPQHISCTRYNT